MNRTQAYELLKPVTTSRLLRNNYGDAPPVNTIWVLATHRQAGCLINKCKTLGFSCLKTIRVKFSHSGSFYVVSGFEQVDYAEALTKVSEAMSSLNP